MQNEQRISWDEYWMTFAHVSSLRGTCNRKKVGAVIVKNNFIISTGYNGAVSGDPHCDEIGHDLQVLENKKENCIRSVHAEENAILQAAKRGVGIEGSVIYTNTFPCWLCARKIISTGIFRVVYDDSYNNDPKVIEAFQRQGILIEKLTYTRMKF